MGEEPQAQAAQYFGDLGIEHDLGLRLGFAVQGVDPVS